MSLKLLDKYVSFLLCKMWLAPVCSFLGTDFTADAPAFLFTKFPKKTATPS